jgi:glycosyltransferase involved in cell wall biosynthesis
VLAVRFAHEVAQRLEVQDPAVRIVIAGGGSMLGTAPNVRYVGHVDDVVPYIDFADVCLLPYPLHAVCGGARLKAMEYLARGKPVLTTCEGVRGIDGLRDGIELALAEADPNTFASALSDLIRDPRRREVLGSAGRRFVAEYYDWRSLAKNLLAVFERLS